MGEKFSFRSYGFLKGVPDKFFNFLRITYPWYATKFSPKLTGITPHMKLMDDMEGLRHKFDSLRAGIKGDMEDLMD